MAKTIKNVDLFQQEIEHILDYWWHRANHAGLPLSGQLQALKALKAVAQWHEGHRE